jgi:hypothetical protein
MNWFINKFKSFNLITQAALEVFYSIAFLALTANAMAYAWGEVPMVLLFALVGGGTLWYHIDDIVKKIKRDGEVKNKK